MNQRILFYAVGWIIIITFAVTLYITIAALVGYYKIDEKYMSALFAKLILEIIAAGFFVFYRGPGRESPPYTGEWHGVVRWTDSWANRLWKFDSVNPHSEGDVYIYMTDSGVYKGFSTWIVRNNDEPYAYAAVLLSNIVFNNDLLESMNLKAYARRTINPNMPYGASPQYTLRIVNPTTRRLEGCLSTLVDGRETEVGSALFERQ